MREEIRERKKERKVSPGVIVICCSFVVVVTTYQAQTQVLQIAVVLFRHAVPSCTASSDSSDRVADFARAQRI